MSSKKDYYEILGVGRDASKADIKKAYRKLALKYHPDKNKEKGAEDRFKEISEAYGVLYDDEKRSRYDQFGHAGIDGQYSQEDIFRGVDFGEIFRGMGFGGGLDDLFSQFFGGGPRRGRSRGPARGSDLRFDIEISLDEAFEGFSKEISVPRQEVCPVCSGSGAKKGSSPESCSQCGGSGQVRMTRQTPFGMFTQVGECPKCHGQGKIIKDPCPECRGRGVVRKTRKISISIPKGVEDGMQLRLAGEGEQMGSGGVSGDLYVVVHVRSHKSFQRRGADLYRLLEISFPRAVLGGSVDIETMKGHADLKIPAGVETGNILKMKGMGMPKLRGSGFGDLFVEIKIKTPKRLSRKAKKLVQDLEEEINS